MKPITPTAVLVRQTHLFTKTRKEAPADEVSKNAQLLIRAGFIHKEMAGVYTFLPLGLRTLNRVVTIIREEMCGVGGQEVFLSSLQDKEVWEATGRWESADVDVWFKTALQNGQALGLGFTHEEPITRMMCDHIHSYRDLPRYVYQIQTKFRNETRAKSGIMRTREFPMKDLYSFDCDQAGLDTFYDTIARAYERVFARCGIGDVTYKTFASGGSFSKYSHEYQTVSDAGEDTIYIHPETRIAVNKEVYTDEVLHDLGIEREAMVEARAIEVGNIFKLGTRFSQPLGLTYKNEAGEDVPVVMGSYGIGPSRLMGTVAEVCSDARGLIWPKEVAPFDVHVVRIGESEKVVEDADTLADALAHAGVAVLYDDRDVRAGEKFADSDLIGIPFRVVVSDKTYASEKYELVMRATGEKRMVSSKELFATVAQ